MITLLFLGFAAGVAAMAKLISPRRRWRSHEPRALRLVDQRLLASGVGLLSLPSTRDGLPSARDSDEAADSIRRVIAAKDRANAELMARLVVGASRPRMSAKVRAGLESLLACAASSPERVAVCRHGETLTLQEIRVAIADGDWCACCRKVEDPPWRRTVPYEKPEPTAMPGDGESYSG